MILTRSETVISSVQLFEVEMFSVGLKFVQEQVNSFQNSITMAISLLQVLIILGALPLALSQLAVQLPALIGKHPLGTVALEVISPSTGRDLMTSFFYPTDSSCSVLTSISALDPSLLTGKRRSSARLTYQCHNSSTPGRAYILSFIPDSVLLARIWGFKIVVPGHGGRPC